MRKYVSEAAQLTDEYGIKIGRWSQYRDLGALPFDAMWCVIPPGGKSSEDLHPEVEFAIVTKGTAVYESAGRKLEIPTGGVVLVDPEQPHVIHNLSADEPLTILSIYWLPAPNDSTDSGTDSGTNGGRDE